MNADSDDDDFQYKTLRVTIHVEDDELKEQQQEREQQEQEEKKKKLCKDMINLYREERKKNEQLQEQMTDLKKKNIQVEQLLRGLVGGVNDVVSTLSLQAVPHHIAIPASIPPIARPRKRNRDEGENDAEEGS